MTGATGLLGPGTIRVFGEVHGTNEAPRFIGDLACIGAELAAVTVGLEIPVGEQSRLDQYLSSEGTASDQSVLLQGAFWTGSFKDGRSSLAMLALIERIRTLKRAGADLQLLAFDQTVSGQPRDTSMAQAISASVQANPQRSFVALAGNLHARTVKGTPFDPNIENMAYVLIQLYPELRSFDIAYTGGSAWVCTTSCGTKTLSGNDTTSKDGIELYSSISASGYHGLFHLGMLSASLPAVP